ncbi:MAG: FKBP-type peptidyl-prolyl cis-trans isomerase FkpA [Polaribacter sp.]|jgi:FKBP-type peptidyl-prolyl cis-trans isomerase FkpA
MKYTLLILFLSFSLLSQAESLQSATDTIITIEEYLNANELKAQISDKGVYYHLDNHGNGAQPQRGDYVKVRFKGMLLNGKVFDQSPEKEPFVFQLGYRQVILGWEHGIPLFPVGSKGSLYVPAEMAYGSQGVGMVPPNTPLLFEIELLDILTFEEYDDHLVEMEKKQRRKFEEEKERQFKADKKIIQEYIISNKIKKAKRDDSGVSYALSKKGKGDLPKKSDLVEVSYKGYLTDGSVFDKGKYTVELGKGKVIKGWEKGLPYFKNGSKGWIIVPSKLAYGPRSIEEDNISIPGNSVLVFEIEILEIKRAGKDKK